MFSERSDPVELDPWHEDVSGHVTSIEIDLAPGSAVDGSTRWRASPYRAGAEMLARWLARDERAGAAALDASRLALGASAAELTMQIFFVMCDPGDAVLVPEPALSRLGPLAQLTDVQLVPYPMVLDGAYRLDASALFDSVDERTRLIVAANPFAPTGNYLGTDELELLASFGLPLLIDERLRAYAVERAEPPPRCSCTSSVLTFALDGLATRPPDTAGELAWVVTGGPAPDAVASAVGRLRALGATVRTVGAATIERLDADLASAGPAIEARRARCRENLRALRRALAGSGAEIPTVEGGVSATVHLPPLPAGETATRRLLERHGVLVAPIERFDLAAANGSLVVTLLAEPDVFARAAEAIRAVARDDA